MSRNDMEGISEVEDDGDVGGSGRVCWGWESLQRGYRNGEFCTVFKGDVAFTGGGGVSRSDCGCNGL